jgi:hypothetical protein
LVLREISFFWHFRRKCRKRPFQRENRSDPTLLAFPPPPPHRRGHETHRKREKNRKEELYIFYYRNSIITLKIKVPTKK